MADAPIVALDARYIQPELSGIGRYTLNLLRGLAAIGPPNVIVLTTMQPSPHLAWLADTSLKIVPIPGSPWNPVSQLGLASRLRRMGVCLLHSPDVFGPLHGNFRKIITLHDVIPLLYSDLLRHSRKSQMPGLWKTWLRAQCAATDAIVAISAATKADSVSLLKMNPGKVHVIHQGVPPLTPTVEPVRTPDSVSNAKEKTLLYVGRMDPHKNVPALVRAFARVCLGYQGRVKLVIVGKLDARYPEAQTEARRLQLEDRVEFTDYLDENALLHLYQTADAFVFPSLHEGFGLPPLEAMRVGIPVVACKAPGVTEAVGDAALVVEPTENALADGMLRVLREPMLSGQLRTRGLERVKQFDITRQAELMWALYKQVIAGHPLQTKQSDAS